ncbi:FCD domain-containing protein [Nonomuraea fuscirosea]|uniref:FCD domain-containing protein n=1 Tax=Nonomuraea fuscirosea TaxID=1291556 RepID=UPI002DDC1EE7|nr:FCD domain-containing protein [Nonomuraea fuscirosea]WSA58300.1 FCD domain-containing protein [Nonomuraea fuscirosea]
MCRLQRVDQGAPAAERVLEAVTEDLDRVVQRRPPHPALGHLRGAAGFAATHRAVLDAVREGGPDAAETAMRDLLAQAGRDEAAL